MNRNTILLSVLLFVSYLEGFGQPDVTTMDLKHPAKYENKQLGAEKTPDTKFTATRRFMQDNITHYNFYFNANNKLNEVVARAKVQHRDDYTKLLSFYNYSLEGTARDKKELDSIIYKCSAGILIHDLRNAWIDNLYMLMGKSYFFRNMPDSAYITFQYVNYAFSPKEKGGYDIPIGSNANAEEGGNAFTISTTEKRNAFQKVFTLPPSRNEAFIWLVKTYISKESYPEAAGLIEILKHDPQFPARLHNDLEEVQALWFYQQKVYDSAAYHLKLALGNAASTNEKARWEYLIAQMYERVGKTEEAKTYFEKVFRETYDPVMEVYARLNFIRQNKGDNLILQKNIDALVNMAKKDRYESYRDIIYYAVAQIELENHNQPAAEGYLLKSARFAQPNSTQKSKSFLQLGDLTYGDRKYKLAKNYYDSVNVNDPQAVEDPASLNDRRKSLEKIVIQLNIIERQDSLQRLAGLPQAERDAFIKKMVKSIRKQQGLRDEEQQGGDSFFQGSSAAGSGGLFDNGSANAEWYFYNASLKSRGFTDFKSKWGNRSNVDNWQLNSLSSKQAGRVFNDKSGEPGAAGASEADNASREVSFASLLSKLPLTEEKMKISQDSVENALLVLGISYQEGLPDYLAAIDTYEKLLTRFPQTKTKEDVLFNLYYCYRKAGDQANAARILAMMKQLFPKGKRTAQIVDPAAAALVADGLKTEATRKYETIYNAFIEGRFEEALAQKREADSLYGKKFWTSQLLYIEAIYFIRERQDDSAKRLLNHIMKEFAGSPMSIKAKNFLDVLGRRKQIEDYLTRLKIERVKEDSMVVSAPDLVRNQPLRRDSAKSGPSRDDTTQLARTRIKVQPQPTAQNRAADSLLTALENRKIMGAQAAKIRLDSTLLLRMRHEMDSLQAAMKKSQADSLTYARLKKQADSVSGALLRLRSDSLALANQPRNIKSVFAYTPEMPHSVVVLVNKVDPVYVTETKNAFSRYNRETADPGKPLEIMNVSLSDTTKMAVISGFEDAKSALDYMAKVKKLAPRDIIPWLPQGKYSFLIITAGNLDLLLTNRNLPAYQQFLSAYFPGKF